MKNGSNSPHISIKRCENYKPHISPHILCITITTLQVNFSQTYDAYHTLTQHEGFFSQITTTQNHHTYNEDEMRWVFFLQGILWQRKGPVCANVRVLMYSVNCFYGWEIKWEWEKQTHTNPFLCPLSDCFSLRCFICSEEERGEQFSVSNTRLAEFPLYTEALYEQNTRSISRTSNC